MDVSLLAADPSQVEDLTVALVSAGHTVLSTSPSASASANVVVVDGFGDRLCPFGQSLTLPDHQALVLGVSRGANLDDALALHPAHLYPAGDVAALLLGLALIARSKDAPPASASARLEQANDTIYTVDFEGRFTSANAAAERLTGYSRSDITGMNMADLLLPEYVPLVQAEIAAKVSGEKRSGFFEVEIRHADGRPRRVEISSQLLTEGGQPVGIQGIARDVSRRYETERRVRFHAELLDSITFPAVAIDTAGKVVYWNAAAGDLFGYTAAEAISQSAINLLVPAADQAAAAHEFAQMANHQALRAEFNLLRRDGTIFPARVSGSLLRDGEENVVAAMAIVFDLSELYASEERYRAASEQSLDAFFILAAQRDENGTVTDFRFVDMNPAGERLITHPREQAIGRLLCELIPVNRSGGFFEKYLRVLETGETLDEEFAIDADNVRAQWLHHTVVKLGDGIAITSRDITSRKRRQEEIDEVRRELDAIFQSSTEVIMTVSPELRLLTANKQLLSLAKGRYGSAPVRGDYLRPWVGDDEWEGFQENCRRALAGERISFEMPFPLADGTHPWYELSFGPVSDEAGSITAIAIVARDVQERRAMEQQLAEREASLSTVFGSMNEALTLIDAEGRFILGNPLAVQRAAAVAGREPKPGDDMAQFVLPQHVPNFRAWLGRALAGEHVSFDSHFQLPGDAGPSWTEYHYHPVRDTRGEVVAVSRVSRDITDRKRAEADLHRATMYHRAVIENLADSLFVLDVEGEAGARAFRIALINSAFERLTGLRWAECVGRTPQEVMPPEAAAMAVQRYEEAIAAGHTITYEEVVPLGRRPIIQTSMTPIFDDMGRCTRIVGSSRDLSELYRLQTEERAARQRAEGLALIVESASDAIIGLDLDKVITYWNGAAERIYGWSAEEAIGRHISVIWPTSTPERARSASERLERVASGESLVNSITKRRHKSGRELDVQVSAFPLRDLDGRVVGIASTATDITDRLRAEAELRERAAHLQAVFASTRDQLVLLDTTGRIVALNARASEAFFATRGQSPKPGDHYRDWLTPADHDAFDSSMRRVLAGESFEYERAMQYGEETAWLDCAWSPVRLDTGEIGGAVTVVRNITQRKRTSEALMQAQKLESLAVLAGGIAHDFNNLLVGILGNAGLALMEVSPNSPARETLVAIETAGQRAAELARQMLAYSGRGRFVVQQVDLSELVDEMLHLLRVSIGKGVRLQVNLPEGLPQVTADATQLRQVVMNLVVNASDAIGDRDGVVALETSVVAATRKMLAEEYLASDLPPGRYLLLEVRDSGSGMEPETLKRIFDPFFTTKFTGRGLGLAAVLGIIKGHQGAINVQTTPGEGTTFRLLFPALTAAEEAPRQSTEPAPWRGSGTVLVVDDEATVRAVTARALRAFGFETLEAEDGLDGLEMFDRHRDVISAVVLDMTMPRMGGDELFLQIRKRDPAARVILMSGYTEQDAASRFSDGELAAFIQKPFELATLRDTLRRVLEG